MDGDNNRNNVLKRKKTLYTTTRILICLDLSFSYKCYETLYIYISLKTYCGGIKFCGINLF